MKKYFLLFVIFLTISLGFIVYKNPPLLTKIHSATIQITCIGKNKELMRWGFSQNPVCVTTYPDIGKKCTASSQCLSNLCVLHQAESEAKCRGLSENYPMCVNGEATIEAVEKSLSDTSNEALRISPFFYCD